MCKKLKYMNYRIDNCMLKQCRFLYYTLGIYLVASCCGHGKYKKTIIVEKSGEHYELYSMIHIPRKKRFYKRDSEGYYYIPEVEDE